MASAGSMGSCAQAGERADFASALGTAFSIEARRVQRVWRQHRRSAGAVVAEALAPASELELVKQSLAAVSEIVAG